MRSPYEEPTPHSSHGRSADNASGNSSVNHPTTQTTTGQILSAIAGSSITSNPLDTNILLLGILEILVSVNAQLVQLNSQAASGNDTTQKGFADMNDQLNAIDQELKDAATAIAARIDALLAAVAAGTVTPEQVAALQADADALRALGVATASGAPVSKP